MAAKDSRHTALAAPLAARTEKQVARGERAPASDPVPAAIRQLKERQGKPASLRAKQSAAAGKA